MTDDLEPPKGAVDEEDPGVDTLERDDAAETSGDPEEEEKDDPGRLPGQ